MKKPIKKKLNKAVVKLSKIQIELMLSQELRPEDFNQVSEMITSIKEYIVNCKSYIE